MVIVRPPGRSHSELEATVTDQLTEFVEKLSEAHGVMLKSVVLYGSAAGGGQIDEDRPKKVLVVLDRISPAELKAAHGVAEWWREKGNPLPVYFTDEEIADSSDVFPIEFIDMSQVRRVLYGEDPFKSLDIPTTNLRHQLEYELRGKLLRLRRLYIPASRNANQLARLMADSLDNFAVLFRHILIMRGKDAPFDRREAALNLAEELKLDKATFARVFDYAPDQEVWIESETNETFAKYLDQIERVIEAVDKA